MESRPRMRLRARVIIIASQVSRLVALASPFPKLLAMTLALEAPRAIKIALVNRNDIIGYGNPRYSDNTHLSH